ncbi:aldehyde dehydrogenase family protein [Xanthobacter autotrophicus DSM 431]
MHAVHPPLMILCKSLAAVLASGCTMVVKPSEYTPLTTLRLAQLMTDNGLPTGVFNGMNGVGASSGRFLAEHPDINKLVLTGGTEAGRIAARPPPACSPPDPGIGRQDAGDGVRRP